MGSAFAQNVAGFRTDETVVTLKPGEATEIKLLMKKGDKVYFTWASSGVVNFDMHGENESQSKSYEKGRAVPGNKGVLEAAFDGNHGWFWRNRGRSDVSLTLRTRGDSAAKRIQ